MPFYVNLSLMSKGSYINRARKFVKHEKLSIIPAPNRVLIRITRQQIEDLTSKEIKKSDGTTARLFFEPILFDKSFERSYQQNVSIGSVVGVGDDVQDVIVGDTVILDYLSTSLADDMIGAVSGDTMISIVAKTTYHKTSSVLINARRAWVKGDYDNISRILGIVRGDELIPFDPYIFLEYKADYIKILSMRGEAMRSSEGVVQRRVIAAPKGCEYKCGDDIFLKKDDWFDREINER